MPPLKILIVDDAQDILTILKSAFETQEGFVIQCVSSGEEALKKGPEFQPDLILLDFLMPGMDGMATYEAMKCIPSLASIPVVILTAFTDEEKIKSFLKSGVAEVIMKPFDPWALPSQIRSIFDRYSRNRV